jgi:hypothetical protein
LASLLWLMNITVFHWGMQQKIVPWGAPPLGLHDPG